MFGFNYYLVAICGTFTALGIGILIGVSYCEDMIIYNQREIILEMERELELVGEKKQELNRRLERWEEFKGFFWSDVYSRIDWEERDKHTGLIFHESFPEEKAAPLKQLMGELGIPFWSVGIEDMEEALISLEKEYEVNRSPERNSVPVETGERLNEIYGEMQASGETAECRQEKLWSLLEEKKGVSRSGSYGEGELIFLLAGSRENIKKKWMQEAGGFLAGYGWSPVAVYLEDEQAEKERAEKGRVLEFEKKIKERDSFWIKLQVLETIKER